MLQKIFDFFVFTSLFIATCALLMVYQNSLLFNTGIPLALYGFVFFGAVCSYNFHWFLTPPGLPASSYKLHWNLSNRKLHLFLSLFSLLVAAICAILLIKHWRWLGLTAVFTFLYSAPMISHPLFIRLRKIAIGKTIYLAFAWTHVTALLPLLLASGSFHAGHSWFVVNRFFFLYAICIVFDRRDRESDRKAGVKSLITWLDEKGVDRLFWFSQAVVLVSCYILHSWLSFTDLLALFIPSLILSLLYERCKRSRSDYLYYFLLDGLMALSAPILILLRFAR